MLGTRTVFGRLHGLICCEKCGRLRLGQSPACRPNIWGLPDGPNASIYSHAIRHQEEGSVRRPRSSLQIPARHMVQLACAALTLGLGGGCVGGAAQPTPTVVPSAAISPAPAASPQRPP